MKRSFLQLITGTATTFGGAELFNFAKTSPYSCWTTFSLVGGCVMVLFGLMAMYESVEGL